MATPAAVNRVCNFSSLMISLSTLLNFETTEGAMPGGPSSRSFRAARLRGSQK